MKHSLPRVLVGNALSTMVAAARLAERGIDVTVVNGIKNWGGHFTTMTCKGIAFDPGMVLHEFTSFKTASQAEDIQTYDPAVKNDAGRFCDEVRRYVQTHQETRDVAVPKMHVKGAVYDDMLIANAFSSLPALPFHDAIAGDLTNLVENYPASPLHASRKYSSEEFKRIDYRTVSLANHGQTLHAELIEPYCKKVFNISTAEMIALYHRVAWLPLFYPETLRSYLGDSPQPLPPTTFSYPRRGRVGDLAAKLKRELESSGHVTIIAEQVLKVSAHDDGVYDLQFANHPAVSTRQLAWSNNLSDLLKALGLAPSTVPQQKSSIALAFLRVPVDALRLDFTVLSIVDPEIHTYRVTNQSACAGDNGGFADLVVEANPDYAASERADGGNLDLSATMMEDLVRLGVVRDTTDIACLELKQMRGALQLPNTVNRANAVQEANAVRAAFPEILLLGPSSGFFSSSFNDQVVQGLKLASAWEGAS